MTTHQVYFYGYEKGTHQKTPYIRGQEPIEYFCDGKEGYIHFDGYYYVENHAPPYLEDDAVGPCRCNAWLPQKLIMFSRLFEKESCEVEVVDNVTKSYFTPLHI